MENKKFTLNPDLTLADTQEGEEIIVLLNLALSDCEGGPLRRIFQRMVQSERDRKG